jgi:hypothetical protein
MAVLARIDAPSLRAPFSHTVLQALRAEALSTQEIHGVKGHDAVRPAAIRDDVVTLAQVAEAQRKIRERH